MKKRKKPSHKGFSDSTLQKHWRKACISLHCYGIERCKVCNTVGPVEVHHIIRRRHRMTRHDPHNGIPVCVKCHKMMHTKEGEKWLVENWPWYDDLCKKENIMIKDYLFENRISQRELEEREMKALKGMEEMNE